MTLWNLFQNNVVGDFMKKNNPEILYHYCSLETFLNIIKNRTIWLSDVTKSNDKQELRHLKSMAKLQLLTAQNEYLKRYSETPGFTYDFKAMESLNNLAERISLMEIFSTWVFCLSEEPDLLSQWRGYADNAAGICIGFDFEYLNKISTLQPNPDVMFQLKRIKYEKTDTSNFYAKQIDIENTPMDFDAFKDKCKTALYSSFSQAPFYKNSSFSEEKEWRISLTHLPSEIKELKKNLIIPQELQEYMKFGECGYIAKQNKLVSHVELNISDIKNAIKEIIIGPKCEATDDDILYFLISQNILENEDDKSIDIYHSSSSYR